MDRETFPWEKHAAFFNREGHETFYLKKHIFSASFHFGKEKEE